MIRLKYKNRWLFEFAIAIVIFGIAFILVGRILRTIAVNQIEAITNTKVEAESVHFNLNGSVLIENLVIRPQEKHQYNNAILRARTVYARFGLSSLLLFNPQLKKISIKDFVFNAQQNLDTGIWNLAAVKIGRAKSTGSVPTIRLKRGKIQYSEISAGRAKTAILVPIDAKFEPDEKIKDSYNFEITTAKAIGSGKSKLNGTWRDKTISVVGQIASADVPMLEGRWTINTFAAELNYEKNGDFLLKLNATDLLSTRRMIIDTEDLDKESSLGKHGSFATLQGFFRRYRPNGLIDVKLEVAGNMTKLKTSKLSGAVVCKDISLCDRKFLYPIGKIAGRIDVTEKSIVLNNLSGKHKNVALAFNGFSKDFGPNWQYEIKISSGNMALDDDLYNALNQEHKWLWSSFSPKGLAAIDFSPSKKPHQKKIKTLTIELLNAEAKYEKFAHPLKNLTGKLVFSNDGISVLDVVSDINGQKIKFNGLVVPSNESEQISYDLSVLAQQVQLDEDTFSDLHPKIKKIVSQLQPKGKINITADLSKSENQKTCDYKIIVDCLGNSLDFKNVNYPLKDVRGKFVITKNFVEFDKLTAVAANNIELLEDGSAVKINGRINLTDAKTKKEPFKLIAKDIFFDSRIALALPDDIGGFYSQVSPTGRFDLELDDIKISDSKTNGKQIDFFGSIKLKDCNLNLSPKATEINALLKAKISYNSKSGFEVGKINLFAEKLKINGKTLTAVKANIEYDKQNQGWLSKDIVANCYGGKMSGKFELRKMPNDRWQYTLQTGFADIDLEQFLRDGKSAVPQNNDNNHNYTSGTMAGSLSVGGKIGNVKSRIGRCLLNVENMKVGKLSPIAKLLAVLKLTEPKDFAFDRMLVDSYIRGGGLFFEKFDLSGKSLAFTGSGTMDLPGENINLNLTARGRRLATAEPSILQSLTEGLGRGLIRIEITGDANEPQIKTKTLPVLEETLDILGESR